MCVDASQNTGHCDYNIIGCAPDHYCPSDFGEFAPPPVCVERGALGESCMNEEHDSCLVGLACNFNECQQANAPAGSACEPYVVGWQSVAFREYDRRFPAVCAQGTYCRYTGENDQVFRPIGECTALKAIGEDCDGDHYACSDGYCNSSGKCAVPELGSTCGYRRQGNAFEPSVCPAGSGCYGATCKALLALGDECQQSQRPCPPDSLCHQATPSGPRYCTAVAQLHEECSETMCSPGTFCVNAPAP